MPKANTPRTPSAHSKPIPSTSVATKEAQRKANNARITELLYKIRHSAGLAKSFSRPAVNTGEYCQKKAVIFTGQSDNANSSNHPGVSKLGQLYYRVFCSNSNEFVRLVWEPKQIPQHFLESNAELINLLVAREMLRPIPRTGSMSKGNTHCTASSSSTTSCSKVISLGTSTLTVVISDDDSDVEIIDGESGPPSYQHILVEQATVRSSPAPSSTAPKCKLLRTSRVQRDSLIAEAMSSPASSDKDEVEHHFRTKHGVQTSITLYVFTKLGANLDKQLVGLKSAHSIDQYIAATGVWREIKWNSPFVVRAGSVIAVKASNVTVNDWNIHAPHIFDNQA
ncbi:hypothetical protein BT96DRAFT_948025 [Gymnopus androsaceus JB14]|uniref:Uncharacterized protein n=1 Tax=Gymnopus androsaceus JB14 TaxID=1447944 RepID=A0A6A4GQ13_9AGAR|nr:hypothetical protein BT96DRAFT_948025 [Gymnopus androsaceus JB14]